MFLSDPSFADISRPLPLDAESEAPTPRMLAWARNSTIWRLQRQMLTEKQLSDAIRRKAKDRFEGISESQIRACSDHAVAFAHEQKALDDTAYAEVATRSGVRGGRSRRAIAQRLAAKGIDRETVASALEAADDLHAAVALARKRAFGPFRKAEPDARRLARELSAFARGGFGFDMAKRVCSMPRDEAEEILFSRRG